MGHLINPTGFRVGYFSNWADIWVAPSNFVYAELLHSTLDCKQALGFYFENFVTDRYSIMYSHFTSELTADSSCILKMYFYDGIVEQKVETLSRFITRYNRRMFRSHRRLMRRFKRARVRFFRVNHLYAWRYYDFLLARKIVFFFIYMLNFGRIRVPRVILGKALAFFFKTFARQWLLVLRKKPNITVYNFVRYYLKNLVSQQFFAQIKVESKIPLEMDDLSNFFFIFRKIMRFWLPRQNFFRLLINRRRTFYSARTKGFLPFINNVNDLSHRLFVVFYRLFLLKFRQSRFFKFMLALVLPVIERISLVGVSIEFFGVDTNHVTAIFLARYLSRKIEMRFRINELFTPITRDLNYLINNTAILRGYKMQFTGRLTRRDRVRTTWAAAGSVPLSTMEAQIEHAFSLGILRNGICCLRVWLYRHKSYGNYNHKYAYRLKHLDSD